jgi:hypothetical protein
MTFFVTHEGTNYRLVNELFNRGNEIASHTVTYFLILILRDCDVYHHPHLDFYRHKMDLDYWKNASVDFWQREIGYQRHLLHAYGNIPFEKIQVISAGFLLTR